MIIAVLGSLNLDVTAYLARLPRAGETLHGSRYQLGLGGKGANQAVAAQKLGGDARFIARAGADAFGDLALKELASYGLDLSLVRRDADHDTGLAIINVGAGGENTISLIGGANLAIDSSDVARGRAVLENARVLLLQLEVPLAAGLEAAAAVRASGGIVILDPAPAPETPFSRAALAAIDILTPNEVEAGALLGWQPASLDEALEAARALRAKGVAAAIVKIGAMGLGFSAPDAEGTVAPFPVLAIDTVAAGDCFNGGLAHALARGRPFDEAVRFAAACGALATTKRGAAAAAPTGVEVEALLA